MSALFPQRYTRTAIVVHWVLAVLIIANLAFGLYMSGLPLSPQKLKYLSWHKWVGVTVLIVSAARLLWRLSHSAPALLDTMKPWEKRLASSSHTLLYALFFAAPLTGWLFSSAAGFQTVYLGVLPIPDLLAKNEELADVLKITHRWINYTMATLIVLHVAAALKHHFVDRDDVMACSLPLHAARYETICPDGSGRHRGGDTPRLRPAEDHPCQELHPLRDPADERAGRGPVPQVRRERCTFDPARPEATQAQFEVDLGSIDLGNEEGETEARRKPWLHVQAFPKATFVAASVKSTGAGKYEASGPLTIKGVSHYVVAPFTFTESAGVRTVEGQFPLKRLLFKIGEGPWSDTDTVADEVLVRFRFSLPAIR